MTTYTKRRFQLGVFINGFNANIMNPVLKEIVFISKAIADIKLKIINHDLQRVIRKTNSPLVSDTVIFTVNMKLVQVVITPALNDLDNKMKCSQ